MHPARSVILFTTLSGLGFGMLFWMGLGVNAPTGFTGFVFFAIAFALSVGGLISSTFHLGHPERALKAFTQWRTSWLSREGWFACVTLIVMALYGAFLVFASSKITILGWLGAIGCLATVFATSMIYAQLKTVPRWNAWTTNVVFMGFALGGGALMVGQVWLSVVLLALTGAMQIFAWIDGDSRLRVSGSNLATATGLGKPGRIRAFEPPHTGGNYLTKEMVFQVGRKHAIKLRVIGVILAILAPIALLILPFSHILAAIAILSHIAGVLTIRWLFFAEAEHVVGFYYGRSA